MGGYYIARTTRTCADCPKIIPVMGNKKRCDGCQEKVERDRLRAKRKRKAEIVKIETILQEISDA